MARELLKFELIGLEKIQKQHQQMLKRAQRPGPVMKTIAARAWKDVITHFSEEEGPRGKWKPLAKSTRARKGSSGSDILKDTGRLRASISFKQEQDTAVVFTKTEYANIHEQAKVPRGKKIPQRRFMWLKSKTIEGLIKGFSSFMVKAKTGQL